MRGCEDVKLSVCEVVQVQTYGIAMGLLGNVMCELDVGTDV